MGGNTLVEDGNFDSYENLCVIDQVPVLGSWNVIVVDLAAPKFQYIAVQSMYTSNSYLGIVELEVHVY